MPDRDGECFANSARFLVFEEEQPKEARLVHAIATGRNQIDGVRFAHAWVEIGDWVFDVTHSLNPIMVDKKSYYKIGNVEVVASYTANETRKQMLKSGHFGPWHERFEKEEIA